MPRGRRPVPDNLRAAVAEQRAQARRVANSKTRTAKKLSAEERQAFDDKSMDLAKQIYDDIVTLALLPSTPERASRQLILMWRLRDDDLALDERAVPKGRKNFSQLSERQVAYAHSGEPSAWDDYPYGGSIRTSVGGVSRKKDSEGAVRRLAEKTKQLQAVQFKCPVCKRFLMNHREWWVPERGRRWDPVKRAVITPICRKCRNEQRSAQGRSSHRDARLPVKAGKCSRCEFIVSERRYWRLALDGTPVCRTCRAKEQRETGERKTRSTAKGAAKREEVLRRRELIKRLEYRCPVCKSPALSHREWVFKDIARGPCCKRCHLKRRRGVASALATNTDTPDTTPVTGEQDAVE